MESNLEMERLVDVAAHGASDAGAQHVRTYCYTLVFEGDALRICTAQLLTVDQAIQHGRVLLNADVVVVSASGNARPSGMCVISVGEADEEGEPVGCWRYDATTGEFTWSA